MQIRLATSDDLPSVMRIVREVVKDMMTEGNLQWDERYPTEARFLTDIENEALYVADSSGSVLGFVTIDEDEPKEYRGLAWSDDGKALFIHRLAVARDSRNLGVASKFEAFACDLAQEYKARQIRVDTYSTNQGMQVFLGKKGYRKVGEMYIAEKPDCLPFFCYEKLLRK